MPQEGGFVADGFGLAAAGPIDGVGEDDEADEGVASGLGEDSELGGRVGVESAGGGGFGSVIDGETGPDAVCVISKMECVADEREGEESDGAKGENSGDGEGGVFVVGVDGAFGGDDGTDTANRGANGEKRGEFGAKSEEATKKGHEHDGPDDFNADEEEADSAEFPDVAKKEARTEKDNASFEPEFVGGDTGLEDGGEAENVGDDQAEEDGPQDVFDVGENQVVGFDIGVDVFFEEFARVADDRQKSDAGDEAEELRG